MFINLCTGWALPLFSYKDIHLFNHPLGQLLKSQSLYRSLFMIAVSPWGDIWRRRFFPKVENELWTSRSLRCAAGLRVQKPDGVPGMYTLWW